MLCSEHSIVNSDDTGGEAATLKCKRWSCEICRPRNRWEVIKKAEDGRPTAMLTLTVDPAKYECPDDAARDMVRGWSLLRRHLARDKQIEKVPFLVVFEKHESGWPHMHILLRTKFIAWGYLKRQWQEIVGANHVHILAISSQKRVAHYVSKYIGKDPWSFEGCKRWWRSHNYDLSDKESADDVTYKRRWQRIDVSLDSYIKSLDPEYYIIKAERPGYVVWEERFPFWAWEHRKNCARRRAEARRRAGRRS